MEVEEGIQRRCGFWIQAHPKVPTVTWAQAEKQKRGDKRMKDSTTELWTQRRVQRQAAEAGEFQGWPKFRWTACNTWIGGG